MLSKILGFFASFFDGLVSILDLLVSVLLDVIIFVLDIFASISHASNMFLLNRLPNMPTELGGVFDFGGLAFANNYLPISEAVALLPVWAYIFCGVGCYKFIKLIKP